MLKEKPPKRLTSVPVFILDSSLKKHKARAAVKKWTPREAFWRGFRQSAKIVGILVLLPLPFAFLEPFAFMVWGSLALLVSLIVIGPVLHLKFWSETESFFHVEGECPSCHVKTKLKPYLSKAFTPEFTAICPDCGQTCTVNRD